MKFFWTIKDSIRNVINMYHIFVNIIIKETTSKKEKVIEYLSFLKGTVLMRHCHRQKRHLSLFTSFEKRLQKECNCAKDTGRKCTNTIRQHMVDGQSGHQDKGGEPHKQWYS